MANKLRPKGDYKDYLNLNASDIAKLSDAELRGIVAKLNDTANKRISRLDKSGFGFASPSYRYRAENFDNIDFNIPDKPTKKASKEKIEGYRSELKNAYAEARNFLLNKTSSISGTLTYSKGYDEVYSDIIGAPLDDPRHLDKRFKEPTLKESVKNRIKNFWEKYHQWREILEEKNPDAAKVGTDISSVEYFIDEVYSKGQTNIDRMKRKAEKIYKEHQKRDYGEDNELSTPTPDGGGETYPKRAKYTKTGGFTFGEKFAQVQIFPSKRRK